jgi:hypothetical protein
MDEGYSICFNEWALDQDIKNELGLLLIISSLTAEKGYCYASNEYFANLFNVEQETISRKIKKLEDKKYITIDYKKRGCQILAREIRLTKISIDDYQKYQSTIDEKVKENNISINNISINKKENIKRKVFKKPTIDEIKQYCLERNNGINAEAFYDFYESKDWYVGKNRMKDWKACVRTWEQRNKPKEEKLPSWWNLTNDDFEEENDEYKRKAEAIRNGTYKP